MTALHHHPDDVDAEVAARRDTPVERARTLPGRWYADPAHHDLELDRVFGRSWVGVGLADDVAAAGSYLACRAGRVPVLVVRDDDGRLRAFLNVCRHRGSPLADGCGRARALRCPYHGWVYRLDGSLARAGGVGTPEGFDEADYPLREVGVTTFARSVLVNVDPHAAPFDPGRLAGAADPFRVDELEVGRRDRYECAFNWKVLLENYSENYHTPFVHPELPAAGYEYPMEHDGPLVVAWDRPRAPRDESERALHDSRPGAPGWEGVAEHAAPESFNNGVYLTLWPNTMLSVFAGFAATFRLTPTSATTTVIEREYLWHPSVDDARREADYEATRRVVAQDVEMCEAVQRTYSGGCSADGVLSTEHETGVAHLHRLLAAALDDGERPLAW
jgi:phenylpropionate dioxygenase-like ring-hydroxylating dioxygenase large terminal subunit